MTYLLFSLTVGADVVKNQEMIFLYQHEASLKTLMLHLPTAPKSLFFLIKMSSRHEK